MKRNGGNPTTILVGSADIIDDLKSAVAKKFPNSLARYFDPADIQIQLRVHGTEKQQQMRGLKQAAALTRFRPESSEESLVKPPVSSLQNQNQNQNQNQTAYISLEPDQNVWEILDEYFPGSMSMSDALLIDVEVRGPSDSLEGGAERQLTREDFEDPPSALLERVHSPLWVAQSRSSPLIANTQQYNIKPQQPIPCRHDTFPKYRSASPNLPGAYSPPLNFPNQHKGSLSNPPQSPVSSLSQLTKNSNSQAVLLLPKNFSLGDQHTLKRYSIDGSTVDKGFHEQPPKLSSDKNVTNLGNDTFSLSAPSFNTSIAGKISSNPIQDQQSKMSSKQSSESFQISSKNLASNSSSRRTLDPTKVGKENKDSTEKIKNSQNTKSKETTINTNTFEKVLPLISVLVVEDNSINQAILGAFLRKHKIHYEIAKNGQEAVDKWRKGGFHLVLMDIQLPVKSGIEATKEIRYLEKVNKIGVFAQHELANSNYSSYQQLKEDEKLNLETFRSPVIIVALTASSNSSIDKKNALTAGCNDFLTKPVNLVWLQNKITEWGCMQALIDFDAWRVKGSPQNISATRKISGDDKHMVNRELSGKKPLTAK